MRYRHLVATVTSVALTAATALSSAQQTLPPGHPQQLPAGHPPINSAASAQPQPLPAGHPPINSATSAQPQPLPPGHPSISPDDEATDGEGEEEDLPPGHPATGNDMHPGTQGEPPADRVDRAPDLGAGTVEVTVRDERDLPVGNQALDLTVFRQDVAEGDSTAHRSATTDAQGRAVFSSLPQSTDYTFHVAATRGPATFVSDSFQLASGAQRVLLHTYPSTNDIRQALVGLRGIVVIEPREDVFRFEASYEIFNIGKVAWVPNTWNMALPDGAKAFQAAEGDARFDKKDDSSIRLLGTFGPGRREVGYSFQLANDHLTEKTFRIPLPPHVAELRVAAEAAKGMKLEVPGMPEPQRVLSQSGAWMFVTGRQLTRGESPLESVTVTLTGLPAPSPGRWYALGIAVVLGAAGLWVGLRGGYRENQKAATNDDANRARRLLLDELVLLERLRANKQIGPRSYESSRGALLDALGRLEVAQDPILSAKTGV